MANDDYEVCWSRLTGSCPRCVVGPHNRNCNGYKPSGWYKTGIDRDGVMVIEPLADDVNHTERLGVLL